MSTEPTQVVYPSKATLRTGVQVVLGLAVAMPFLVQDIGLDNTIPIVATVLGVSAVIARVMAIPAVNILLAKYLGLGAQPKKSIGS